MNKLNLRGESIFIREWEISDATELTSLNSDLSLESAEIAIIDWMMKFEQTKLSPLPVFNLQNELIAMISLKPTIKNNKAQFSIQLITKSKTTEELLKEAKSIYTYFAQNQLGITEIF